MLYSTFLHCTLLCKCWRRFQARQGAPYVLIYTGWQARFGCSRHGEQLWFFPFSKRTKDSITFRQALHLIFAVQYSAVVFPSLSPFYTFYILKRASLYLFWRLVLPHFSYLNRFLQSHQWHELASFLFFLRRHENPTVKSTQLLWLE